MCSESVLNRGSRLNNLLALRPTKEKLEQMNVIKRGSNSAHSNLAAAQTSLSAEQRKNRLANLLHKRPDSLDLTKRTHSAASTRRRTAAAVHAAGHEASTRWARCCKLDRLLLSCTPPTYCCTRRSVPPARGLQGPKCRMCGSRRWCRRLKDHECVTVGCGFGHTIVLTRSGEVLGFGNVEGGRLGRGQRGEEEEVEDEEDERGVLPHTVKQLKSVAAISAGDNHSSAVTTSKGELWGWGSGQWGRLGTGDQADVYTPVRVPVGRG